MQTGIELRKTTESARQELESLRRRAAQLEATIANEPAPGVTAPPPPPAHLERSQEAARRVVGEQWQRAVAKPSPAVEPRVASHPEAITLKLTPEEHDERMGEFIYVLQQNGVAKAIEAAEATANPHLIDDFHRVLVEWVHEGLPAKGAESEPYRVPLSLVLYEVTLPQAGGDAEKSSDPTRTLRESISLMEQFYRGMLQMDAKHGEYFSFEIANPAGAAHTSVFVAVPRARKAMFEKQLMALYPAARLEEKHDDYNAFASGSQVAAASATQAERHIYSLRTFDAFPNDPLDSLLNAFSKLDEEGEGAAIQFVVSPHDKGLLKRYRTALQSIHAGTDIREATHVPMGIGRLFNEVYSTFSTPKKLEHDERLKPDDPRLKNIENKIASPILLADIRVVVSAATASRAKAILEDIEAPFQQFADTAGNRLTFNEIPSRKIGSFAHTFSYRILNESHAMPLSAMELATLAHLPRPEAREFAPDIHQDKSQAAAAPIGLPKSGVLLGINRFRNTETPVYMQPEDRLRHLYIIGQTGAGKSTLLKNVIIQDIKSGAGVCFIDPHGSDVLEVLSAIPPERMDDVIYFDPGSIDRPMGLNMLEYDPAHPEQKTLVVDELFGIFKKLFGAMPESMGPAFEQYFRNSALLVMDDPASGNTLLDISRVFADENFRARKLAACKNPIVKQFWEGIALKTSGEQGVENYGPYVTNKFDVFTTNDFVRPMIAQQKSAFNFRDLMDNRKILLVNLAKGRIGDINANLLGLIIVGKFLIAALSRSDSVGKDLPTFYLHVDEFQNFATPSISTILSEARKYKLSLTMAHQFIAQLTDEIKDAVFGNVGSLCAFRVGADDGEFLQKQFAPTFTAADLMNVDNRNAYVKLLINGKPSQPFNIETLPFQAGTQEYIEQMQALSALRYGRPRAEIEAEIAKSFGNVIQDPATLISSGL